MNEPAPRLSVVVPSVNGLGDLRGCLDALVREGAETPLEILVPERCGEQVRQVVRRDYPAVVVMPVSTETTIPAMRAAAFRVAHGEAVAVIEDHVLVPLGWARRLLDEIAQGAVVVGGSVSNAANDSLVDRAAFLCEYSHCLPPLPDGPATWLTGNNVAYRRDLLQRYQAVAEAGHWENYLHDRLRHDGVELICRSNIQVAHKKHYRFTEYLSQRYLVRTIVCGRPRRRCQSTHSRRLRVGVSRTSSVDLVPDRAPHFLQDRRRGVVASLGAAPHNLRVLVGVGRVRGLLVRLWRFPAPGLLMPTASWSAGSEKRHVLRACAIMLEAMLTIVLILVLAQTVSAQSTSEVRGAVTRALPMLQRSAGEFVAKRACLSCHHNSLAVIAFRTARSHGFDVDPAMLEALEEKTFRSLRSPGAVDEVLQASGLNDPTPTESYLLMAAHAAGLQENLVTALYARRMLGWQRDSHWVTSDFRPPSSSSLFTATATAVRAIPADGSLELSSQSEAAIVSARQWLLAARPVSTEDAAFRLMGLIWAGSSQDAVDLAERDLLALQKTARRLAPVALIRTRCLLDG